MILDFVKFVETYSPIKYYPHSIPVTETGDAGMVRILPTYRAVKGGVASVELQIIIRASHPEKAEQWATELQDQLDKKTSFNIGDTRVILMEIKNPFPLYIGKDENDRYKYSVDAWILIEK
ncbi:minor capsid protein [Peribacillus muralis]|uniref:minor capsid protein n=1 Tax=Peribacillus muralis TaxID=264697 RepID=UPI00366FD9CC